jgi:hypothetical protein
VCVYVCARVHVCVHRLMYGYILTLESVLSQFVGHCPEGIFLWGDMLTTKSTAYMPYFATMQFSKVGFPCIPMLVHTLATVLY